MGSCWLPGTCVVFIGQIGLVLALNGQGPADVVRVALEGFGSCMSQIITSAQTDKHVGMNAKFLVYLV